MKNRDIEFHIQDYDLFPYEERFAEYEVEKIADSSTRRNNGVINAKVNEDDISKVKELTYIAKAVDNTSGDVIVPDQTKWEAQGNGVDINKSDPYITKQSTRYSLHGLHEYKGKFNPQMVRAIGNLLGLSEGDFVVDPFCGSGTTLLEALHIGWNAVGTDLNPLAILVANNKVDLVRLGKEKFQKHVGDVIDNIRRIESSIGPCDEALCSADRDVLRDHGRSHEWESRDYLEKWYPDDVLLQLRAIITSINQHVNNDTASDALRLCVSNIARETSLQDPDDLRIRRRKDPQDNYPALSLFLEEVEDISDKLSEIDEYIGPPLKETKQCALMKDSTATDQLKEACSSINKPPNEADALITSPPYASALPYIDTNRLSLLLLGLVDSDDLKETERSLIGCREIKKTTRRRLDSELVSNKSDLPDEVHSFLTDMLNTVKKSDIGFRRRNTPALLYKYFSEMKSNFEEVRRTVQSGTPYALVVGVNTTKPDGKNEVVINTPNLLSQIATQCGLEVSRTETLNTYQRYGLHHSNSIKDEKLVILKT